MTELGEPAVEPAVSARTCVFDSAQLRWVPDASPSIKVTLTRSSTGTTRLVLGSQDLPLAEVRTVSHVGPCFLQLHLAKQGHVGLHCEGEAATKAFVEALNKRKADYERFEQYEQSSVQSYFQYYAKLGNQQNMLQDSVRTGTYRRAIVENPDDFGGATVMDIGAGSGILSFFAAQAGASLIYPVEASSMGEVVRLLADTNNFPGATFEVLSKPLESIQDDEVQGKVDVLVSEPIGTFLFNERMIETYLCARDRFLKPGGKMFPNVGHLCIAPFSDAMLHWEQQNKNGFWKNSSFYGIDLNAAVNRCTKEHFRQPIVDYINPDCLVAKAHATVFDFMTVTIESLHNIEIPFDFEVNQPCLVHGMAGWFDAFFQGTNSTVVLSTAPSCPGTHWYQIRFLLETPLAVNAGQHIEGTLKMEANNLQSYYVRLLMKIQGTTISSEAPCIDLKDPEYRFYTSANAYCPPGTAGVHGQQAAQPAQNGTNGTTGAQQTYQQQHFQRTPRSSVGSAQKKGRPSSTSVSSYPTLPTSHNGSFSPVSVRPSAESVMNEKPSDHSPLVMAALRNDQTSLKRLQEERENPDFLVLDMWASSAKETLGGRMMSSPSGRLTKLLDTEQRKQQTSSEIRGGSCVDGYLLRPSSTERAIWDIMLAGLLAYDIVMIPFIVGFNPQRTVGIRTMEWITMVFWTLDIPASLVTGYHTQLVTVLSWKMIAKRYFKTWFILDGALVSFDWVTTIIESSNDEEEGSADASIRLSRTLRFLRFARALRLVRLVKVKRLLEEVHDRLPSEGASICFRIFKIVILLMLCNHGVACIWHLVGVTSTDKNSWIVERGMEDFTIAYRYSTSLHWSLSQFTPASMEVFPAHGSINERVFSVVVIVFAMITFSSFVSILTASMAELRKLASDESHQFWLLRRFLRDWSISYRMSSRIQRYLEYASSQHRRRVQFQDVPLLKLLSGPMHNELMHETLSVHLKNSEHSLFHACGARTRIFGEALSAHALARGDPVFTAGQLAISMYFVAKGTLVYVLGAFDLDDPRQPRWTNLDADSFEQVNARMYISEAVLYTRWLHVGDMEAATEAQVVTIESTKFAEAVAKDITLLFTIRSYAMLFVRDLNKIGHNDITDLLYQVLKAEDIIEEAEITFVMPSNYPDIEFWDGRTFDMGIWFRRLQRVKKKLMGSIRERISRSVMIV